MSIILVFLSIISAVGGFFSLSQATMGVGILAVSCLLAILARIAQADAHHKELVKMVAAISQQNKPGQ